MKYHVEFDIDFKRNESSGLYVAIEGIDGSGKSTQIERLFEYFKSQGKEVVKTREPRKDEGLIGELIQKILHGKTEIPPVAFQYLFSADRQMHHSEVILPSLREGKVVLSDRCFWSAIPYGITDRGGILDPSADSHSASSGQAGQAEYMLVAQSILSMYHQFTLPDLTFYLDIPLSVAMERIAESDEKKEIYEDKRILEKIIKGYNWLLQKFPQEFKVIDATSSVTAVTEEIISIINKSSNQLIN